ncbi:MAG: hypothetical protein MUC43_14355 [Pirellula sp.]|jgi:hypothetical protein|nr:hypothetical protein [Pirellula sp.]
MPRKFLYRLVAGCSAAAFLWFIFVAAANARRAAVREQRRQEQHVQKVNEDWIRNEIERLTTGQSDFVFFYSTGNTDALIKKLSSIPEVRGLTFETTDLSDLGVTFIATLPNVEKLTIHGGTVGNSGLSTLRNLENLKTLHMVNLELTDDGLVTLLSMKNLETLTVYSNQRSNTKLTDSAIMHLRELKTLKKLNVGGGWLSLNSVNELKSKLPDCIISQNYADDEW